MTQEIGERHAYQWAIHVPTAADGKEQPHVHLMFSDRIRDGIRRDPDEYFRRFNRDKPELGGCQKAYSWLTMEARKATLVQLRENWQAMCNKHPELAQRPERIDMRSYAAQGLNRTPERKMQPGQWRDPAQRQPVPADTERRGRVCPVGRGQSFELHENADAVMQRFMAGFEQHERARTGRSRATLAARAGEPALPCKAAGRRPPASHPTATVAETRTQRAVVRPLILTETTLLHGYTRHALRSDATGPRTAGRRDTGTGRTLRRCVKSGRRGHGRWKH